MKAWLVVAPLSSRGQHYLLLVWSDSGLHFFLDIGPLVMIRNAHALRSFFRGQETRCWTECCARQERQRFSSFS